MDATDDKGPGIMQPMHLERVRELLRQGSLEAAAALADELLKANVPPRSEALYLRGVIANRQRDHARAIAALQDAVALQPAMALAWLALGNAHARVDDDESAAHAYRAVLAREPGWADAHFNLGVIHKRRGDLHAAARAFHAAWKHAPTMFDAARHCVSAIAECVRRDEAIPCAANEDPRDSQPLSFTIGICSIDEAKSRQAVSLYEKLFADVRHEVVVVRAPRSLAEAYNHIVSRSTADAVVLSHDDIHVLADDFAQRLTRSLNAFDCVGPVGSLRVDGPAIGWSGHPHLRGWIIHREPADSRWSADVLHPGPVSGDIAALDGVLIAARRQALAAIPFDVQTFDGFHLYDLDWSYRAARQGLRLGAVGNLLLVHASRGEYGDAWSRYADRFTAKHGIAPGAPRPSSFFGTTFVSAKEVRGFFSMLEALDTQA